MSKQTRLACPICGMENDYFEDPLGPFCSSRCKLVDLGKWLGEEYRVGEPLRPDHFAEFEDLQEGEANQPPENQIDSRNTPRSKTSKSPVPRLP